MSELLNKLADYNYTPDDWKKYTTKEERRELDKATKKYGNNINKQIPSAILLGGVIPPVGAGIAAGISPSWTIKDLKEFNNASKNKYYIPGYGMYTNFKILGLQRAIQQRVEDKAKQALQKLMEDKYSRVIKTMNKLLQTSKFKQSDMRGVYYTPELGEDITDASHIDKVIPFLKRIIKEQKIKYPVADLDMYFNKKTGDPVGYAIGDDDTVILEKGKKDEDLEDVNIWASLNRSRAKRYGLID